MVRMAAPLVGVFQAFAPRIQFQRVAGTDEASKYDIDASSAVRGK
jgi:hypothetical protein